jgi:hypothetical protein
MRSALSKSRVVLLDKVPTERSCKRLFFFETGMVYWVSASIDVTIGRNAKATLLYVSRPSFTSYDN